MRAGKNQRSGQKGQSPVQQGSSMQLLEPKNRTKGGIPTGKRQESNNSHGEGGRKAGIQADNPQVGKQAVESK